ncbi:methyltransferase type 11 [Salpingoeca rosetta]|uniref:Arsenite methyltransferase n=1 Tax=Salpingoeca rosetta (strain ATCC 50818 / BSB-021) TaxID=946362 RepID=F2TZ09_SALR5|nr:methyltransferase type 11 [Salpingoeca rosetta]EGD78833.1 methyltransferase type 11 [Salpingoeca rosetta]|eukprot:XP_004997789.1 methyltransferase type 11 [Salpingoeca rosetta]
MDDGLKQSHVAGGQTVIDSVKEYYGKVLQSTESLKTSACTTCCAGSKKGRLFRDIPDEIISKYYGCGSPFPEQLQGLKVVDLGSGSGRDCYALAKLVGKDGFVTGVDMTEEQLDVARRHVDAFTRDVLKLDAPNMKFVKGYIEDLVGAGIEPESQDLIVSNCVVNLSPDKPAVLKGVYDILKEGGELFFSDVYADRRLSDAARKDPVLFGECIGGALYERDFIHLAKSVGFADPREVSRNVITVNDPEIRKLVGNATFYSITYRLFKLKDLEPNCEDYGQVAVYKGTIPDKELAFNLDKDHTFEAHRPVLVCGNTASMLTDTRYAPHFTVTGNREKHFGAFPCGGSSVKTGIAATSKSGGCC